MIKPMKMVALLVMLLSSFFASQVFADELGDKLANAVCWNLRVNQSYTLSTQDEQNWQQKQIQGTKQYVTGPQTVAAVFAKQPSRNNGACTITTAFSGAIISCDRYDVKKSGATLTMVNKTNCKP